MLLCATRSTERPQFPYSRGGGANGNSSEVPPLQGRAGPVGDTALPGWVYREKKYSAFVKSSANKFRGTGLATLVIVSAACLLAPGAALAGTPDQQQTDGSGGFASIWLGQSIAQTFKAGLTGGVDQVDLDLGTNGGTPTAPLSVEIRDAWGGSPGSSILASQSVPAFSGAPALRSINFATPAPVVAGTQYAIVAYSGADFSFLYTWSQSMTADPYAGGTGFRTLNSPPSGAWMPVTGDFAFKTYVVPPPTTTGQRAAALKKCKHKHSKKKRKKCRKRAKLLPL